MLLTVTSNPAIDRTLHVPHLTPRTVHRATHVHLAAGGKGLNVTRAGRTLGTKVLATGPLTGRAGQIFADLAQAEGIPAAWHWLKKGDTRTCLLINHDTGDTTVINEKGPTLTDTDWARFAAHVTQVARPAKAVAFAGSLPLGVDPERLGQLAHTLATPNRAIYVDTSGPALSAILAHPEGLCIKVNRSELAESLNLKTTPQTLDHLVEAGQTLLQRGAKLLVVTLGEEGALAIASSGTWQASAPPVEIVSTVGSGDSMLAGLIVARLEGKPLDTALAFGIACGSANVMSNLPGRFKRSAVEALSPQIRCEKR